MLASAPGRSMSRDALAGLLWAGTCDEQAKKQPPAGAGRAAQGSQGPGWRLLRRARRHRHPSSDRMCNRYRSVPRRMRELATRQSLERGDRAVARAVPRRRHGAASPRLEQWLQRTARALQQPLHHGDGPAGAAARRCSGGSTWRAASSRPTRCARARTAS